MAAKGKTTKGAAEKAKEEARDAMMRYLHAAAEPNQEDGAVHEL